MPLDYFTITYPSDMHSHFRQGDTLKTVVPVSAKQFAYVTVMPNTKPPITTIEQAKAYRREVLGALGKNDPPYCLPLMTVYLTDDLSPDVLRNGFKDGWPVNKTWAAAKLYPANVTTNSESGITSKKKLYEKLAVMQEIGMPLLVHGEILEHDGDNLARWLREKAYIDNVLPEILSSFPKLIVILEHISTRTAAEFVFADTSGRLSATITPHHLLFTDADVSRGGLWVDANCLPIIKTADDRRALRFAATSGDPRFFAGTDSAPHDTVAKYCSCCSFGAFVAPGATEAYAAVFDQEGVFEHKNGVEKFERFMSLNGPAAYGLPRITSKVTFMRNKDNRGVTKRFLVPSKKILVPDREIIPLFHKDLGLAPRFPWIRDIPLHEFI